MIIICILLYISIDGYLGPIGPPELGLSVCLSVGLKSEVENVHWGPLDDSRMGNGEWGMGNIKLPSWKTVLIKLIDDLTL